MDLKTNTVSSSEKFQKLAELNDTLTKIIPSVDALNKSVKEQFRKVVPTIEMKNLSVIDNSNTKCKNWNLHLHNEKEVADIRTGNIQMFYKQIVSNIALGVKSIYTVCLNLNSAQKELSNFDFTTLVESLPLSESTIAKYQVIGKCHILKELYDTNNLPEAWTTQYFIASLVKRKKLNQSELDEVVKMCSLKTTQKDILEKIFGQSPDPQKVADYLFDDLEKPRDFIKVAIETKKGAIIDPNVMLSIKLGIEQAIDDVLKNYTPQKLGYQIPEMRDDVKVQVAIRNSWIDNLVTSYRGVFEEAEGISKELRQKYRDAFDQKLNSLRA
jgi:hypothetical protein